MPELSNAIVRLGETPQVDLNSLLASFGKFPGTTTVKLALPEILPALGVTGRIAQELTDFAALRLHCLEHTPAAGYDTSAKRYEGRGIYLYDAGDYGAIYLKGCGAPDFRRCNPQGVSAPDPHLSTLPAFNLGPQQFMFVEDAALRGRVRGAMALQGAVTEFLIAAFKMAQVIERYEVKSLAGLMALEQPIPIGVGYNHDLSEAIQRGLRSRFSHLDAEAAAREFAAQSCGAYGTVACWFPSNLRAGPVSTTLSPALRDSDFYRQGYQLGAALRFDLLLGWYPTSGSGHLQNIVVGRHAYKGRTVDFCDQFPLHFASRRLLNQTGSAPEAGQQRAQAIDQPISLDFACEAILIHPLVQLIDRDHIVGADTVSPTQRWSSLHALITGAIMGLRGSSLRAPDPIASDVASVAVHGAIRSINTIDGCQEVRLPVLLGVARYMRTCLARDLGNDSLTRLVKQLLTHHGIPLHDHIENGLKGLAETTRQLQLLSTLQCKDVAVTAQIADLLQSGDQSKPYQRSTLFQAAAYNHSVISCADLPSYDSELAAEWSNYLNARSAAPNRKYGLTEDLSAEELAHLFRGFTSDRRHAVTVDHTRCIYQLFGAEFVMDHILESPELFKKLQQAIDDERRAAKPLSAQEMRDSLPAVSLMRTLSKVINHRLRESAATPIDLERYHAATYGEFEKLFDMQQGVIKSLVGTDLKSPEELLPCMPTGPWNRISLELIIDDALRRRGCSPLPSSADLIACGLEQLGETFPIGSLQLSEPLFQTELRPVFALNLGCVLETSSRPLAAAVELLSARWLYLTEAAKDSKEAPHKAEMIHFVLPQIFFLADYAASKVAK